MKKASSENQKFTEKIHKFLNANNWIIAFGIIFTFVYLSLKIGGVLDAVNSSEAVIKQDIGKVIVVANDGQIIKLKKQNISYGDKRIALYIANLVQSHLIQDSVSISNGFKRNYNSGKNLALSYEPFKTFIPYLLNKQWLYQYANNVLLLISNDNYPEYINPYNRIIQNFVITNTKTNSFKISIVFKVIKRSYLRELTTANKYKTEYSTINFNATGEFNPVKWGSFTNPFGLKFNNIQITLLTKRG